MKYVIDPTSKFKGAVLTSMRNGTHCDYTGETIREMRKRHNNPHLKIVSSEEVEKLNDEYIAELDQTPFEEIDKETYWASLECLPPARQMSNMFFVGEPYFGPIYPFCCHIGDKFYRTKRDIRRTKESLWDEVKAHHTTQTKLK